VANAISGPLTRDRATGGVDFHRQQMGAVHVLAHKRSGRPEEAEAFDAEEDRIFERIDRLCLPFRKLTKPKFHVFQIDG
jgi:hypothetical protein